MSKILKRAEAFLRFILDPNTSKKQSRFILLNSVGLQQKVLAEIFHNLLKYENILPLKLKTIIKRKRRTLKKIVSFSKKNKIIPQQKIICKHYSILFKLLNLAKNIIFKNFFSSNEILG